MATPTMPVSCSRLAKLKENGEIDPKVIDKILYHNPAKFYGLDVD